MSNNNYYDYRYPDRHDQTSDATPSWVLGLLVGAAVGGGLALLFAPRQGAVTRHEIAARGQQAGRQLKQAYESAAGTARRSAERLTSQARNWREQHADGFETPSAVIPGTGSTTGSVPGTFTGSNEARLEDSAHMLRDAVGETKYTPS